MEVNPTIFRAYDIRGIIGKELTPEFCEFLGKAYGTFMKRAGGEVVVIGRDSRESSLEFQQNLIKGIISTGLGVIDIGLALSPMLYFAVIFLDAAGGVNVTGSHNPSEYNGFKVVKKDAIPLDPEEIQRIREIISKEDFLRDGGRIEAKDIVPAYFEKITELIKLKRPLKIVIDSGNATAGAFAPRLFRRLGCEVIELYSEFDSSFPHHFPDPEMEKNLEDLKQKVIEEKADIGIGFDGDGDRVGFVDEKGKRYEADLILAILARDLLSRHPGAKILFDVKCSKRLVVDIEKRGGVPVMYRTGHSFFKRKLKEEGILLGGEVSGHIFCAEGWHGFDDALVAAAKIVKIVSDGDKKFSEYFLDFPETLVTPEIKVPCADEVKFDVVSGLVRDFKKLYKVIDIDGARVEFDDSWGLVRASNTNPYLTLRFEAENQEGFLRIKKIFKEALQNYPEVKLDNLLD